MKLFSLIQFGIGKAKNLFKISNAKSSFPVENHNMYVITQVWLTTTYFGFAHNMK